MVPDWEMKSFYPRIEKKISLGFEPLDFKEREPMSFQTNS